MLHIVSLKGLPESPTKVTVANLLEIVINVRSKRNVEVSNVKASFESVLEQWQLLENIRHSQGWFSTKAKITIYAIKAPDNDRQVWETDIENHLEELREHHANLLDAYQINFREYKKSKK